MGVTDKRTRYTTEKEAPGALDTRGLGQHELVYFRSALIETAVNVKTTKSPEAAVRRNWSISGALDVHSRPVARRTALQQKMQCRSS